MSIPTTPPTYPEHIAALLGIINHLPPYPDAVRLAAMNEYNAWNEAEQARKRKEAEEAANSPVIIFDIHSETAAEILANYTGMRKVRIDIPGFRPNVQSRWGVQFADGILDVPETIRYGLKASKTQFDIDLAAWAKPTVFVPPSSSLAEHIKKVVK